MVAPTAERIAELKKRLKLPVASFFDFDGTTSERQFLIEFMLQVGDLFPEKWTVTQLIRQELEFYKSRRTYNYRPVIDAAVAAIPSFFRGLRVADAETVARSVLARYGEMTYIFPRRLIEALHSRPIEERGLIIAITGAPAFIAEPFGVRHGFDLVYSARDRVEDGAYTGVRDDRSVHDKGGIMDEFEDEFGLDLDGCMALGDSESDIPMLQRVGFPFAMNPQDKLIDWIRRNPKVVWVNDRQKNGVTLFRAGYRNAKDKLAGRGARFIETSLAEVLPDHVRPFDLPGSVP